MLFNLTVIAKQVFFHREGKPAFCMKPLLILLLLTGAVRAQVPTAPVKRDSVPTDVPGEAIPTIRPNNGFYRNTDDPKNVMRASLDNMPVKTPDSSVIYTMPQSGRYGRPQPRKPKK